MAASASTCSQCGRPGAMRCAGCRSVHYCGPACQRAAWPGHKRLCKARLETDYDGKLLASERDFVLEFWSGFMPESCLDALLPPGDPVDAAAAFERCQAAAMDMVLPGYSWLPDDEIDEAIDEAIADSPYDIRAELAGDCIDRLCTAALVKLLALGVQPGDVSSAYGGTSLLWLGVMKFGSPYIQSAAVLPHALATFRVLLAHAQPGDWLLKRGPIGSQSLPLECLARIPGPPAVTQAFLDVIVESPGGFPGHAVAASPSILHPALQFSTLSFVKALLAAGADPVAQYKIGDGTGSFYSPVHSLAMQNQNRDPRDFRDKLRLLLDLGADLEAAITNSRTPLLLAALNENAAAFDALLAAGAQASALRVDIGSDEPFTVLHQLAFLNNATLITRIVATGAVNLEERATSYSHTPLQYAALHDAPRAVAALLAAGASITATDAAEEDALWTAVRNSSAKAARLLVAATPREGRARYKHQAAFGVAFRASDVATNPGDAAAIEALADARAVAALLA